MKRLLLVIVCLLTALMSPLSALAASPEDVMTENTSLYIKIDPSTLSSKAAGYYSDLIEMFFLDELYYSYELTVEQAEQAEELLGFLSEHLKDNALFIFLDNSKDSTYYDPYIGLITELTEDEFIDEMQEAYLQDNSSEIIEQGGYYSYQAQGIDAAFTFIDGVLLITEDTDTATFFISNYSGNCTETCYAPLTDNNEFQDSEKTFYTSSILDFYISSTTENDFFEEINEEIYGDNAVLSALISESISINKTSDGFDLKSLVNFDSSTLSELNIDFNSSQDLSLYKYMPNNSPIYFMDSTTSSSSIDTILITEGYKDIVTDIKAETDIDIDTLLKAFETEIAFLIEDSNELIPTFTILGDTGSNTTTIQTELDKAYDNLWQEIKNDADKVINVNSVEYNEDGVKYRFTKDTVTIGDSTLNTIDLEIILNDSNNPYALELTSDLLKFTFTMGITDEELLLASTNKNIAEDYGSNLSSNKTIAELIDSEASSIGYFSTNNLNTHIQRLLETVQQGTSETVTDLELTKNFFEAIFSPFGEFTSTEHSTNSSTISEMKIEMDLELLISNIENIIDMPQNYDPDIDDSLESILEAQQDFSDVQKNDWFANDVYYLSTTNIVDGYEDGTYKPNNPINRAEFTKIIMEALEDHRYLYNYFYDSDLLKTFSDIGEFEWYTPYVSTAYENNIIKGYEDGTFKPDNSITRAETAQIITNIIEKYEFEKPENTVAISAPQNFSDISGTEWYVNAIETAYEYKIMTGASDTTFEPNRNINRAESAKVINNLIKLMEAQDTTTP